MRASHQIVGVVPAIHGCVLLLHLGGVVFLQELCRLSHCDITLCRLLTADQTHIICKYAIPLDIKLTLSQIRMLKLRFVKPLKSVKQITYIIFQMI